MLSCHSKVALCLRMALPPSRASSAPARPTINRAAADNPAPHRHSVAPNSELAIHTLWAEQWRPLLADVPPPQGGWGALPHDAPFVGVGVSSSPQQLGAHRHSS